MCQDVGKTLVDVGRQTRIVLDHVERSGRHSALRDALRHQKEVEAFVQRHRVVDDEAGRRVGRRAAVHVKKARADALRHDDVRQFRLVLHLGEFAHIHDGVLRIRHQIADIPSDYSTSILLQVSSDS